MNNAELVAHLESGNTSAFTQPEPKPEPATVPVAEISLYKYIDHESKDAELLSAAELGDMLKQLNKEGSETLILHYGHFFNADYTDVLTLIHYAHQWFDGSIFALSPEEIVFLAIRGDKDIQTVIADLKKEGVSKILGFLPYSIVQSKYYADMDELLIEDRHTLFELCEKEGFSFNYPFNLGQIEFEDELTDMIDFVTERKGISIVLQPNDLIDTTQTFDYNLGQLMMHELGISYEIPLHMPVETFYTNRGFPRLNPIEPKN